MKITLHLLTLDLSRHASKGPKQSTTAKEKGGVEAITRFPGRPVVFCCWSMMFSEGKALVQPEFFVQSIFHLLLTTSNG